MSRQTTLSAAAVAVIAGTALAGCGSTTPASEGTSNSTPASTPATAPTSATPGSSVGTPAGSGLGATSKTSASPSGKKTSQAGQPSALPKVPSDYGQVLIDAWLAGNRAKAATVATPAAVTEIFRQQPVKGLVNYSCEDTTPMVCGWIGDKDVRVEVTLDEAKVAEGAAQAVTKVRLAMP